MRSSIALVGLVLVIAGLLASPLGPLSWVPFIAGIIILGIGLMVDSKAKAAAKARVARTRGHRGY